MGKKLILGGGQGSRREKLLVLRELPEMPIFFFVACGLVEFHQRLKIATLRIRKTEAPGDHPDALVGQVALPADYQFQEPARSRARHAAEGLIGEEGVLPFQILEAIAEEKAVVGVVEEGFHERVFPTS